MSMNLYEILDLDRNASPEEIRRAYRQKALKTHPDKMPVGTSQEEKITAEEEFRQITHAYEILSDPEARRQYDRGSLRSSTMPQETPRGQRGPRQYNTFDPSMFDGFGGFDNDPFFSSAFGRGFQFRDPRELFNSLFADMERQFGDDPVFSSAFGRSPFGSRSSFASRPGGPFDSFGQSALTPFGQSSLIPSGSGFPFGGSSMFPGPMFPDMNTGSTSRMSSFSNFSQTAGSNDRWVSQSKTTNNINGRTETIIKKRDAEGNEHITYITPEGERTTINGVEQPRKDQRTIQSGPPPPPSRSQTRPPPPVTNPPLPPPQNYYSPPPQSQPVYNTQNPYATDPTSYAVNQAPYVAPPPAHTNQPAPTYPPPQPPKNSFADTYNLNRTSKTVDHSKPPSPIRERIESYKRHRSSGEETIQIRDRDRRDSRDRGKDEDDRTRSRDLEREREKEREKERERAKDRERHHRSHTHDKHTQPPSQSPTQEDGNHHHKNRWPGWLGRIGKLFKPSVDRHEAAH